MHKNKAFDIDAEVTFKSFEDFRVGVHLEAIPIIGIDAKLLITHKEFDGRFGESHFEYRARLLKKVTAAVAPSSNNLGFARYGKANR